MTVSGIEQMKKVYTNGIARLKPSKTRTVIDGKKEITNYLRRKMCDRSVTITLEDCQKLSQVSEKAYSGLLRTCTTLNLENAACLTLNCRPLPEYGRKALIKWFIQSNWAKIWALCKGQAEPILQEDDYDTLLTAAVIRCDSKTLSEIVNVFSTPNALVFIRAFETAFNENHEEHLPILINATIVKPVLEEVLERCFWFSLHNEEYPYGNHL